LRWKIVDIERTHCINLRTSYPYQTELATTELATHLASGKNIINVSPYSNDVRDVMTSSFLAEAIAPGIGKFIGNFL